MVRRSLSEREPRFWTTVSPFDLMKSFAEPDSVNFESLACAWMHFGDNHVGLVGDFIKLLLGHCPPRQMLSVARKFSGRCKGLQG